MSKVHGTCEECRISIEFWPSQKRRFCSPKCKAQRQSRDRIHIPKAETFKRPAKGDRISCAMCGNEFYRAPREIQRNRRFCSVPCHNESMVKVRIKRSCGWCGDTMYLSPSRSMIQYCSRLCMAEAKIKRPLDREHNGRRAKKDQNGYVMLWEPEHPNKSLKGWQYEHRLVAEETLERYLTSDEDVHHIDYIVDNNDSSNLEVLDSVTHARITVNDYRDNINSMKQELEKYRELYGRLGE